MDKIFETANGKEVVVNASEIADIKAVVRNSFAEPTEQSLQIAEKVWTIAESRLEPGDRLLSTR